MTTDPKTLLRQAIVAEIDGQRFYKFLAGKATHEEAIRKLTNLAEDEVRHEEALRKMYKKFFNQEVGELTEKGIGVLSDFFANNQDKQNLNEVQYIELAIQAELAATEFYKQGASFAPDDDTRKIFEGMASEEHLHYELLQAEKEALAGNYYWFSLDEGAPLED